MLRFLSENLEDLTCLHLENVFPFEFLSFPLMSNDIPKSYVLHGQLPWIFSFMITSSCFHDAMMHLIIMIISTGDLGCVIGPFCEGLHLTHSRGLLLPLSLALFFSYLHSSDNMRFFP